MHRSSLTLCSSKHLLDIRSCHTWIYKEHRAGTAWNQHVRPFLPTAAPLLMWTWAAKGRLLPVLIVITPQTYPQSYLLGGFSPYKYESVRNVIPYYSQSIWKTKFENGHSFRNRPDKCHLVHLCSSTIFLKNSTSRSLSEKPNHLSALP